VGCGDSGLLDAPIQRSGGAGIAQGEKAGHPLYHRFRRIGEETAVSAMKSGAHDYIMKSNRARLAPAIARELEDAHVRRKRKQAEEEKRRIEAQLLQAQKMEAVGRLTGGVAHDFNNLLTAIRGYVDMALEQSQPDTQIYKDLSEIQNASERAMNSDPSIAAFQPASTHADGNRGSEKDGRESARHAPPTHRRGHRNPPYPGFEILYIFADQTSIEQMILNLVVNARDAMLEGGQISIKAEGVELDEEVVKGRLEARAGRFARLSVTDTGIGMDEELLKHIFEPFFSTKAFGREAGWGCRSCTVSSSSTGDGYRFSARSAGAPRLKFICLSFRPNPRRPPGEKSLRRSVAEKVKGYLSWRMKRASGTSRRKR